jgi:hypothetical protein
VRQLGRRVALLTTVGRNPGDERIADGVARLLLRLGSEAPRFRRISKHDPLSMFPVLGVRSRLLVRRPPGVLVGLGNWLGLNALYSADLIVHCGTPFCGTAARRRAGWRRYSTAPWSTREGRLQCSILGWARAIRGRPGRSA